MNILIFNFDVFYIFRIRGFIFRKTVEYTECKMYRTVTVYTE